MTTLKYTHDDFRVKEVYIPRQSNDSVDEHEYYYLTKRGCTTFEAVERLCNELGCCREQISYAGLKDEDGLTEQLVGICRRNRGINASFTLHLNVEGSEIRLIGTGISGRRSKLVS